MNKLILLILVTVVSVAGAQNPIGKSYQSIYNKYNNHNFSIQAYDLDSPSDKYLEVKENIPPYNLHIFIFRKSTNKCYRYFIHFSKSADCINSTSVLNGLYTYRVSNTTGEAQWYDPNNPTFKIILFDNEGDTEICYLEADMRKLD